MGEEKKITFGFSKVKASTTLTISNSNVKSAFSTTVKSQKNKNKNFNCSSDENDDDDDDKDLITIIEDKKVKSVNSSKYEKKIPIVPMQASTYRTLEELEAIKALVNDAKKASDSLATDRAINKNLKINANEIKDDEVKADDPDYTTVNIEDFGMACLRGMGWKDGEGSICWPISLDEIFLIYDKLSRYSIGIGKTNKQQVKMIEPESRPRGLGLGANLNKKQKLDAGDVNAEQNLSYVKGAYLRITSGKDDSKYGQLVSFDDGLNRILVKLADNSQTVSILQSNTQLVTKKEYDKHNR